MHQETAPLHPPLFRPDTEPLIYPLPITLNHWSNNIFSEGPLVGPVGKMFGGKWSFMGPSCQLPFLLYGIAPTSVTHCSGVTTVVTVLAQSGINQMSALKQSMDII